MLVFEMVYCVEQLIKYISMSSYVFQIVVKKLYFTLNFAGIIYHLHAYCAIVMLKI